MTEEPLYRQMFPTADLYLPTYGAQGAEALWVPTGSQGHWLDEDTVAVYIVMSEISRREPAPLAYLLDVLGRTGRDDLLISCATCINFLRQSGKDGHTRLDRQSLGVFAEPYRQTLDNLLQAGRILHAPQLLMVLAKLAVKHCPIKPASEPASPFPLPMLLLLLADCLGEIDAAPDSTGNEIAGLSAKVAQSFVANGMFNAQLDLDLQFSRYVRRWIEYPNSHPDSLVGSLADAFYETTGVRLEDQQIVAVALWARCVNVGPVLDRSYFASLQWEVDRLERCLDLISIDVDDLRISIDEDLKAGRLAWAFESFGRNPVMRFTDGRLLVVDPWLLARRCFGWLPMYDISEGYYSRGQSKHRARAETLLRRSSEEYVFDVLRSMIPQGEPKRLYLEQDLKAAFGKDKKTADAALDFGQAWIVIEVNDRTQRRGTAAGVSASDLTYDCEKVVDKARQAAATIKNIRASESNLTRRRVAADRTFYPVVLIVDGFPSNPITLSIIRGRLLEERLLIGANVAPLEVIDATELEMAESIVEQGGPTLAEILAMKQRSRFRDLPLRNFVTTDMRFSPQRPSRVQATWQRALEPALEALKTSPEQPD